MYRPANHELAKTAQRAFQDAKVSETLSEERRLLDELRNDELAIVRGQVLAQRDQRLMALLNHPDRDASWTVLKQGIDEGIVAIGNAETLRAAASDLEETEVLLNSEADVYKLALRKDGAKGPRLIDPTTGFGAHSPAMIQPAELRVAYDGYLSVYQQYEDERQQVTQSVTDPKSKLGRIQSAIESTQRGLSQLGRSKENWKQKFDNAKQAYKSALAQSEANQAAVTTAASKLRDLIEKTKPPSGVDNAISKIGLDRLGEFMGGLEEQQASVNKLLDAFVKSSQSGKINAPENADADVALSLTVASTLGAIAKELAEGLNYPQVTALLLESEHLRFQLELVESRVSRLKTRLALLKTKRSAVFSEYNYLTLAQQAFAELKAKKLPSNNSDRSLFEDFASGSSDAKILIAHALINYANAWSVGRLAEKETDVLLIGERHSAALDSSENAVKQWENLIGTPLAQLETLHGSGITTAEITALVNALGLGAIAGGVY